MNGPKVVSMCVCRCSNSTQKHYWVYWALYQTDRRWGHSVTTYLTKGLIDNMRLKYVFLYKNNKIIIN